MQREILLLWFCWGPWPEENQYSQLLNFIHFPQCALCKGMTGDSFACTGPHKPRNNWPLICCIPVFGKLNCIILLKKGLNIWASSWDYGTYEPPHDKTNKMTVRLAKTQISLGIRPVWSESSLSAWRKPGPLATHWAHSEDSKQTGRMPRLIWVFAGRTVTLFVLTWGGS